MMWSAVLKVFYKLLGVVFIHDCLEESKLLGTARTEFEVLQISLQFVDI